jgi:hypothetical protein
MLLPSTFFARAVLQWPPGTEMGVTAGSDGP